MKTINFNPILTLDVRGFNVIYFKAFTVQLFTKVEKGAGKIKSL